MNEVTREEKIVTIVKKLRAENSNIWNKISIILGILCIIFLTQIVYGIIEYDYYPVQTILFFLGLIWLLIRGASLLLNILDRQYQNDEEDKYYHVLERGKQITWSGILIYWIVLSYVLLKPDRYGDTYMYSLYIYDMEWVVVFLYMELLCGFGIPFLSGIKKRQSNLVTVLESSKKSRKAIAEEMEVRLKEAVQEQMKSERMKIDLITNVSHDLKNPLTSIIGYIELMKKEEMSDVLKDYFTVLTRKTDILKDMIEKVFDLAKASSQNIELNPELMEMNRLVKQILADMEDTIEEKNSVMKIELAKEDTTIFVDSNFMYRIVQNLIDNALKYAMKGTRIFIKTYAREEKIYFEILNVSNYPMDFDTEMLKERFIRADASRSTEGNGLGLAIVETYTNTIGGKFNINVDGDTFKATLIFSKGKTSNIKDEVQHGTGISI